MGKQRKQGRRNQRNKKKGSGSNNATTTPAPNTQLPAILQRLRHADPPVRQAALVGLLQSRFSTTTNNSNNNTTLIPPDLLQTLRDQVAHSVDLTCSALAASCLGQYIAVQQASQPAPYNNPEYTAGWMCIFVRRLQDIVATADTNASLELAEKCAYCMVQLVEHNPVVVERFWTDTTTTGMLVPLITTILQQQQQQTSVGQLVQTWIARCVHALWDDNPPLIDATREAWLQPLLQLVDSYQQQQQQQGYLVTALHAAGACLSAAETTTPTIPLLLAHALQQTNCLHNDTMTQVLETHQTWQDCTADATLERTVVAAQTAQHEPARLIARRLKAATEQQHSSGKLPAERPDVEQVWYDTLSTWDDAMEPLQLALEILANHPPLLSCHTPALPDAMMTIWQHTSTTKSSNLPDVIQSSLTELHDKAVVGVCHALRLVPSWTPPWSLLWQQSMHHKNSDLAPLAVALEERGEDCPDDIMDMHRILEGLLENRAPSVELVTILGRLTIRMATQNEPLHTQLVQSILTLLGQAHTKLQQHNDDDNTTNMLAEGLNQLMDIYGPDETFPHVFSGLGILNVFQQCVPALQQRHDDDEAWQETADNAVRFIEYKRELLLK